MIFFQLFSSLGIPALISGLVLLKINKGLNRKDRKDEIQRVATREESILVLTGIQAVGHLSEATAIALRDGKVDGVMSDALDYYHKSRDDTNKYLLRQNAVANH